MIVIIYEFLKLGLSIGVQHSHSQRCIIKISCFKYLGSMFTIDSHIEEDINHPVNTAWLKWRSLSGLICDAKMLVKSKGKTYITATIPTMMCHPSSVDTSKSYMRLKEKCYLGGVMRLDKVRP